MFSFFSDFLYKSICYSFELHQLVDAIQMSNICFYPQHMPLDKVDKKYIGCNLKTTELLDCVLIGVSVVIRSNTVCVLEIQR